MNDVAFPDGFILQPPEPDPGRMFEPVPLRARHDGWSPQKQRDFVAALAECGCVADACRRVGMSTEAAYRLRARDDAGDFRRVWAEALDAAVDRLEDAALGRALHGVAEPRFYKGEQIGEVRRFNDRLTQFILRCRRPQVYARTPVHEAAGVPPAHLAERPDFQAWLAGRAAAAELEIVEARAAADAAEAAACAHETGPDPDPATQRELDRACDACDDRLLDLETARDTVMPLDRAYVTFLSRGSVARPSPTSGAQAAAATVWDGGAAVGHGAAAPG